MSTSFLVNPYRYFDPFVPIGTPNGLYNGLGQTGSSISSTSISPASDSLVLLVCVTGNVSLSFSVSGCGLTWSEVFSDNMTPATAVGLKVWKGVGTPSAGVVTITRSSSTTHRFQIIEIPNGKINQSKSGKPTGSPASLTFDSAFSDASNSLTLAVGAVYQDELNIEAGFTGLYDQVYHASFNATTLTAYKSGEESEVSYTVAFGTTNNKVLVVFEIEGGVPL